MNAHVRPAIRAEIKGFFRPWVCAVEGKIVYVYRPWRETVSDSHDRVLFSVASTATEHAYAFPDGTSLVAAIVDDRWFFDDHPAREEWPTPRSRLLRAGRRVLHVVPEDDTILFAFEGEQPPLDMAMMAFLVFQGNRG